MVLRGVRASVVAVLCAGAVGVFAAAPAHAGRIGDARAQAARAWQRIQSDGQRLERVVERSNRARLRLAQTEDGIHQNEVVLAATRVNLAHAQQALNASLVSAYKSPVPDPLEAALEARNFGQVLEQFALLDRTNTYNAGMLVAIRSYRVEILRRERLLARERVTRRATAASLRSLQLQIRGSLAAQRQRYDGLRAEVRRLIDARRLAEVAASRRVAARTQALRVDAAAVVVNDIGGVSSGAGASSAPLPAPSSVAAGAVGAALGQVGTPYVPGGAAPGGFDCSGLVSWAYAQAGHGGLPHYTGDLWNAGTRLASASELAPGDLVFFDGLGHVGMYIGGGQFVEAPHSGDVVKVTSLAARSDYIGAVRISG
ncbi:MAG TPA: NlpC/P60 family protein [Gaiellales bacterium]|jgi:cell wall-associated NlpC family hydrolase|nr:NlpC/P60 family protein [Gaiellales bacterium]